MDRGAVQRGDRSSGGGPRARTGHPFRKDAQVTDPLRKRRTLKIMIGVSRTSMTTATAAP